MRIFLHKIHIFLHEIRILLHKILIFYMKYYFIYPPQNEILMTRNVNTPFIDCKEDEAKLCNTKYCIGVGNGLDAIYLCLKTLGVGKGDEVLVPSNTFIATWVAVSNCGAVPIPVEPKEETFNIDPTKIESLITKKTKAIIPVHLYGQPAELDLISKITKEYNLHIIEDAAQAHGAVYKSHNGDKKRKYFCTHIYS